MNPSHTQTWLLYFLRDRDRKGQIKKGLDIVEISHNISETDILDLINGGFITIEPTNRVPNMQGPSPSARYRIAEKGMHWLNSNSNY